MAMTIDEILTLLRQTPGRIASLTTNVPKPLLHASPEPGEWSVNEDRPSIRAVSPRAWIKKTTYPQLQFGPSLRAFAAQRAELMAILEAQKPAAWARTATVTGAGAPAEKSLLSYAERMASHERVHLGQIYKATQRADKELTR